MIDNINFGLFGSESASIDALSGIIDIYPEENHSLPVTKTKYPVEDGSTRTDNFVVEDEKLVLRGLVSNLRPEFLGLVNIGDKTRIKEAWGRLRELKNSGQIVNVITLLGLYENMMITNIDSTLNSDTGESLLFTITLEEQLIAETEIVQLAPVKLSGPASTKGSDINGGTKQSEQPSEDNGTILQSVIKGISGVFN
ncbi:hypothetical protein KA005_45180 [bacterium]|nr:hypothetical protein [bacterium]